MRSGLWSIWSSTHAARDATLRCFVRLAPLTTLAGVDLIGRALGLGRLVELPAEINQVLLALPIESRGVVVRRTYGRLLRRRVVEQLSASGRLQVLCNRVRWRGLEHIRNLPTSCGLVAVTFHLGPFQLVSEALTSQGRSPEVAAAKRSFPVGADRRTLLTGNSRERAIAATQMLRRVRAGGCVVIAPDAGFSDAPRWSRMLGHKMEIHSEGAVRLATLGRAACVIVVARWIGPATVELAVDPVAIAPNDPQRQEAACDTIGRSLERHAERHPEEISPTLARRLLREGRPAAAR